MHRHAQLAAGHNARQEEVEEIVVHRVDVAVEEAASKKTGPFSWSKDGDSDEESLQASPEEMTGMLEIMIQEDNYTIEQIGKRIITLDNIALCQTITDCRTVALYLYPPG